MGHKYIVRGTDGLYGMDMGMQHTILGIRTGLLARDPVLLELYGLTEGYLVPNYSACARPLIHNVIVLDYFI